MTTIVQVASNEATDTTAFRAVVDGEVIGTYRTFFSSLVGGSNIEMHLEDFREYGAPTVMKHKMLATSDGIQKSFPNGFDHYIVKEVEL